MKTFINKKRLSFILLLSILALPATVNAKSSNGYANAYIKQLERMDNNYDCDSYFIHDISGDGVPELFVITGECEMDYMLHIFTYRNGKVKKITTTGAGHSGYKKGNGCLICGWGHQGSEAYWKLYLKGGKLKSPSIKRSIWNNANYVDQYDIDDYSPLK
ncbi:MAG: hypothetical protein IKX31_01170 [Muribaculaceae bacterium]|nr:hypothetical protein [Muribaculaceae bacterium]